MDLADQIDDYICTIDGVGDLTMDTLAMVLFAWAVIALFLVWLCKFLYTKYAQKKNAAASITADAKSTTALKSNVLGTSATTDDLLSRNSRDMSKDRESSVKPLGAKGGARGSQPIRSGVLGALTQPSGVRKRLSRKSPGPELRKPRAIQPPSNVVGPETVSVTWASQVFRWLYSDLVIVNELLGTWVQALNDYNKKSLEEHGVAVEIVRVLPESPAPQLSNIFCNCSETVPNDVTLTMDCECTPVLQLKSFRQKAGKVETSHYKATVSRFRGRLTVKMDYYKLFGDLKTEGYPEVRITMNSIGTIKGTNEDETQLQEVISEILTNAIRNTIFPIDFTTYSTCPRPMEREEPEENMEHLNPLQQRPGIRSSGRRLLVKVMKGEGLVMAEDPYCVIEMDEPPQKNQTGARQGKSPFWDEHFLFDLSNQSAELLFEIYDRGVTLSDGQHKFLGLGLVGIDELAVGPASSQVLALQPRPYETEKVSGAIHVEFVFIDGADIPIGPRPYKLKNALKINSSNSALNDNASNNTDIVDTAIKAIEQGALNAANGQHPSKSTLIIHSVQRPNPYSRPFYKPGDPMAQSSPHHLNGYNGNTNGHQSPTSPSDEDVDERGRPTVKKRDFFGTLKKKLSRSKSRAKSADRGMIPIDATNPRVETRSISADRSLNNTNGTNGSLGPIQHNNHHGPAARLVVPTLDQSRRSSLSESSAISGFSSASAKTYVHEASTLVLETIENGVKRHFLVPLSIAQKPRWRKKGTKLHIYNDHTFVAKHLSGGLLCDVCNRSIPRRPGKQGYECRDCLTKCHKQCHVRAPQACTNPTVLSIELSTLPLLTDSH